MLSSQPLFRALLFILVFLPGMLSAQVKGALTHLVPASRFVQPEPESSAWDMAVDTNNYVYWSSRSGVYRFNGYKITPIEGFGKLARTPIPSIFKDARQRLWVSTYTTHLGIITAKGLEPYRHNDKIQELGRQPLIDCYEDLEGQLHLTTHGNGYFQISDSGEVKEILGASSGLHGIVYTYLPDGKLLHFVIHQNNENEAEKALKIYFLDKEGQLKVVAETSVAKAKRAPSIMEHHDGAITFSDGDKGLLTIQGDSLIYSTQFTYSIIGLFEDSQQNIWIGTTNFALHRAIDRTFTRTEHYLGDQPAQVLAEEKDGGLFINAQNSSFYYLPRTSRKSYSKDNARFNAEYVLMISAGKDRAYVLTEQREIAVLEADSIRYIPLPPNNPIPGHAISSRAPNTIYYDKIKGLFWVGYRGKVASWDGKEWRMYPFPDPKHFKNRVTHLTTLPDGTLIGSSINWLFRVKDGEMEAPLAGKIATGSRFINIEHDSKGTIWIATLKGLMKWENESYQNFDSTIVHADSISGFIRKVSYSKGYVWINTRHNGLYSFHENKLTEILDSSGTRLSMHEIGVDYKGDLWGRSLDENPRLIHVFIADGKPQVESLEFDVFGDLQSSFYPYTLAVLSNDRVILGMKPTIYQSDLSELRKKEPLPNVIVKDFFVNNDPVAMASAYDLVHTDNSIQLHFEPISYRRNKLQFRYRLVGLESDWHEVDHQNIQFTNLAPGDYQFQVQARIKFEEWGPEANLDIHIQTPFWQTWWFLTLCLLALIGFIGISFLIWFRIKHKRATQQSTLIIEKLKAEQRALKAQMNPHFMFNALSSIQELVFTENKQSAFTNISLFAKLMRRVLNQSNQERITLSEEIETLRLYLQLESLRFEDNFKYSIESDSGLQLEEMQIPPVLIQPFVENAIKHGLLNKDPVSGQVQVRFELSNKGLKCVVEDNGVGREKSAELKANRNSAHRSFGTQSVLERIDLLNLERTEKIMLTIYDLYNDQKRPAGTRVELLIP